MAPKGRKRYEPDPSKFIEQMDGNDFQFVRDVLARPDVASDLPRAWLHVQEERLRLAGEHLAVAEKLNDLGVSGEIRPEKRSVVSRAYYAMFCAARAAVSYHSNGDRNDHKKLPGWVGDSPLGKQAERDRVVNALNTFRAARNEADYSPFYPRPLGEDARQAIKEARAVVKTCKGWVRETAKARTPPKLAKKIKGATS